MLHRWIVLLTGLLALAGCETSGDLGQARVPQTPEARAVAGGRVWPVWQHVPPASVRYGFDSRADFAWDDSGLYGRLGGMSGDDVQVTVELLGEDSDRAHASVVITYQISLTSGWEETPVTGPDSGHVSLPGQQGSFLVTVDRPGHRRRVLGPEQFATRTGTADGGDDFGTGVSHGGEFWLAWEALGVQPTSGPYGWKLRVQASPAERPEAGGTLLLRGEAMRQAMHPQP